jgi:hypothetical protein
MRHFLYEPLILRCPAVETHDGRRNGRFIEENEPARIEFLAVAVAEIGVRRRRPGDPAPQLADFFLKVNFK